MIKLRFNPNSPSLVGFHCLDYSNGEFCGMTVHIAASEIVVIFQIITYAIFNYSSKISHISIFFIICLVIKTSNCKAHPTSFTRSQKMKVQPIKNNRNKKMEGILFHILIFTNALPDIAKFLWKTINIHQESKK